MTYLTGSSNAAATSMELSGSSIGAFAEASSYHDVAQPASNEKWPLWWTVLGVIAFCATFWTALFSIIF
nr:hypothetical protein [Hyphomonas sp. Mor2]